MWVERKDRGLDGKCGKQRAKREEKQNEGLQRDLGEKFIRGLNLSKYFNHTRTCKKKSVPD